LPQLTQAFASLLITELRARAFPAGIDKDIETTGFIPRRVRDHTETFGALHWLGRFADEKELEVLRVEQPPAAEDFPRPDEVEFLGTCENGDRDPQTGH
jgi:hypothetical protein